MQNTIYGNMTLIYLKLQIICIRTLNKYDLDQTSYFDARKRYPYHNNYQNDRLNHPFSSI